MKIAYVVLKSLPYGGGIEKYTEEIGSRFAQAGNDVVVYTMRHYACGDNYRGMRICTVPAVRARSFEKLTASFMAALRLERDVDIVHFHAFGPSVFSFIPRLRGRRVVVQGHGLEWKRSKWGVLGRSFLRMTEYPSVRFAHRISVVSRVQQRYLKDRYGVESVYIPTGVNPVKRALPSVIRQRHGLCGGDYILFLARLVPEKGAHYLIDAYNSLRTDRKLVIAGDAAYEDGYKSSLHAAAAGNRNIIFTGFVSGRLLEELFSNCYFYVLPSVLEGLPTTLLEAMSYGNCCLAGDIEENLEALGGNGYTFAAGNVAALAAAMESLLADASAVEAKRSCAQRYVLENFSWDGVFAGFQRLYGELLEDRNV